MEGYALPETDGLCSMEMTQQILPAVPSVFDPEPPALDSPHVPIVHSALPLLEPRLSGCKWNFMPWPLKRLSASPVVSPRWTETPLLFTAGCYLSSFPGSCRLGSPAWGLDCTLLRGNHPATEISLWNFSSCPWEPSQPSCASFALPVTSWWLFLSVFGYKASLQLVFSWLF